MFCLLSSVSLLSREFRRDARSKLQEQQGGEPAAMLTTIIVVICVIAFLFVAAVVVFLFVFWKKITAVLFIWGLLKEAWLNRRGLIDKGKHIISRARRESR